MNRLCLVGMIGFVVSGCAVARHAVPVESVDKVTVCGLKDIRAVSGCPSDIFKDDFLALLEEEEKGFSLFDFKASRTYAMLAISGGSANGAYGAGLLCGWSRSGTRPVFKVVTGISSGALIAPFAFLGSGYDGQLEELSTRYSTKDILRIRLPFVNSFASSRPLERLIERYFDETLLKEVATAHKQGRRLYVGTTSLDAQRLVIWDMGKIASNADEQSLRLFRRIILASASIPVAFPPVRLNVEVGEKTYDELHVDGGVTRQVFFLYDVLQGLDTARKEKGLDASRNRYAIYVIRNGYVDPVYMEVPDKLAAIAARSVDTMTNVQGIGDLYQLYVFTKDNKGDFNLAYIPATHVSCAKEPFDPLEMKELFALGFQEAAQGYLWRKTPPGIE